MQQVDVKFFAHHQSLLYVVRLFLVLQFVMDSDHVFFEEIIPFDTYCNKVSLKQQALELTYFYKHFQKNSVYKIAILFFHKVLEKVDCSHRDLHQMQITKFLVD